MCKWCDTESVSNKWKPQTLKISFGAFGKGLVGVGIGAGYMDIQVDSEYDTVA